MMVLKRKKWAGLNLLLLLGTIDYANAEPIKCKSTGWNFEDKKCPQGLKEVYKDQDGTQSVRRCCDPNHEDFKATRNQAKDCRVTECSSGNSPNLCSTFDDRYVDGNKLEYEEILRESCTKNSGDYGMAGLCCVQGSTEGLLATTMGAEQNEFPHMAKLLLPGHCGGTIYNNIFLITAAHCVVDKVTKKVKPVSDMKALLGTNIGDMTSTEYVYGVKRAIPHPQYSRLLPNEEASKERSRIFNDIALLELNRTITFGPKVKTLGLAPQGFRPLKYANDAVIVGWGTTDTMDVSVHLQKANFVIRSDKTCFENNPQKRYGPHYEMSEMTEQLLCVGGIIEGKWSPTAGGGDSGGPAICRGPDGKAVLCGVTSYGGSDEDCLANQDEANCIPSVYAEVSHFRGWIEGIAGKQDTSSPHMYKPYLYGQPVQPGMYEHQVHITSADGKSCGGTLVSPEVVVTAASCVLKDSSKGRKGVKITTQKGKTIGVKGVAKLPGFERVGEPVNIEKQGNRVLITDNYHKNDLAIIKLNEKVDIAPGKLAELPSSSNKPDYGTEVSRSRNVTKSNVLMQREFKILDFSDCQARMNRMAKAGLDVKVDKNLLCGVEIYSGGSQCDRELGGGLICKGQNGKDVLCGVQVFRLCEWSVPNGFLNLGIFKDWARSAMQKL